MSTQKEPLVQRLARLAKLNLTAHEETALTREMDEIIRFADRIRAIDTSDVPMTHHIAPLQNGFREDQACAGLPREIVLGIAPVQREGCIAVPRTVEEGSAG